PLHVREPLHLSALCTVHLSSLPYVPTAPLRFSTLSLHDALPIYAAIKQLKDGESVWFGNDVLKEMDRKTGYLDTELYKTDELFDVDTYMTKAERLATGEGEVSHAMTLVGVDLDNGEIRKWKVENSWSEKSGRKGYFTMSDKWFDEFVYEVVVRKEFLTEDQKKLAESKPTPLPAWDSLA